MSKRVASGPVRDGSTLGRRSRSMGALPHPCKEILKRRQAASKVPGEGSPSPGGTNSAPQPPQRSPAAWAHRSRIHAVKAGPGRPQGVSITVTVPVAGTMCAAVPVPPTHP